MSYAWLNELNAKQLKAAAHDLAINTDGMCEVEATHRKIQRRLVKRLADRREVNIAEVVILEDDEESEDD